MVRAPKNPAVVGWGGGGSCMSLIAALRRQRQENLCQFEAAWDTESFRTAKATQRNSDLKNKTKQNQPIKQTATKKAVFKKIICTCLCGDWYT
jgi:poly(3-hydroxyalkanoate) synthetase